jgi:hypothetical protein
VWRSAIALIAALQVFGNANDSSLDTTAPTVTISSPTSSTTYDAGTNSSVTVAGASTDATGVALCRVTNALTGVTTNAATTGAGAFTLSVSISVGSNAITVTCMDPGGNQGTDLVTVTRSEASGGGVQIAGVQPNPTLAEMSIPTPPFGLNETVANIYGSDTYATHVINNTGSVVGSASATCTNTSNPTGSMASPRCSFPTLTGLAAGSVVQYCGNFSLGSGEFNVTGTGTAMAPIFFRTITGCPAGSRTLTTTGNGGYNASGSYIITENIQTQSTDGLTFANSDHIVLRDSIIVGSGTDTDSGQAIAFSGSTDGVRARNIIGPWGDWDSGIDNADEHCMGIGSNITRLWDLWNTAFHCGGDSWGNAHQANLTTTHLYAGGNEWYESKENCLDLKEAIHVIISRNWCHDILDTGTANGEGFIIHYDGSTPQQGAYNTWVLNNLIERTVFAMRWGAICGTAQGCPADTPNYAIGNIIKDCTSTAIDHNLTSSPTSTFFVLHNTIINCPIGIHHGTNVGGFTSQGNIVVNSNTNHFRSDNTAELGDAVVNNDLYYNTASPSTVTLRWGSTTYTTVAAAISGTSDFDNSLQADPLFTNFASGVYSLTASSPARGAGVVLSSYETLFQATFGTSLLVDYAGTARPASTAWDMGAYQYVAP